MMIRSCIKILMLVAFCSSLAAQGIGGKAGIGGNAGIGGSVPCVPSDNFPGSALSANWTVTAGAFSIASNLYTGATLNASEMAYWNGCTATNDQFAQFTFTTTGASGEVGVCVRMQLAAASGYCLDVSANGGNAKVFKLTASALTQLSIASGVGTPTGSVWKITIQGTAIKVYKNAVLVSALNISDSTYSTGQPGIFGFSNAAQNFGGTWSAGAP